MAGGKGSHWLIESAIMFYLCVTRPPEIFVNFDFNHIHAAAIYTINRSFGPSIYCPCPSLTLLRMLQRPSVYTAF